jgi:hypothetical protein
MRLTREKMSRSLIIKLPNHQITKLKKGMVTQKKQAWRSLVALGAGILLFVLLAMLMVWLGSMFSPR